MVAPSTSALLTEWNWEPSVLIGVAAWTAAYAYLVGPLRRKYRLGPPAGRRQVMYFIVSQIVLILSLLSPLDEIGDAYLFSAHMVQHLLLATVWPPLLLAAIPAWAVRALFQRTTISGIARFLTNPIVAIIAFNFDIYLWHFPYLYDLTLTNEMVHIFEHLTFMGFGLVVWWPVVSPTPEQRLSYPLQIIYLFANSMFMMVLGILFTFSPVVFYHPYAVAPRLWGTSALGDQAAGGLIMWYPGNIPYAAWIVIAFYRWFAGEERPEVEPQRLHA